MGIRFNCPNGHKLNVKEYLAGKRGVCPQCGAKFIIPAPTELAAAELSQPVGIGLSQSVEILASAVPSPPVASTPPAASVVIPVTEAELLLDEPMLQPPAGAARIDAPDLLPTSIVPGQPQIAIPPEAAASSPRERSRRSQILVSFLLLGLVVVLAGVLVWVLKRNLSETPPEKKTTTIRQEVNQTLATVDVDLHSNMHSRGGALAL